MTVSNIYLIELWWRFIYILLSFFITFFVVFSFPDVFLFLEIYPFAKFVNKILIATYVTELFHAVVDVCFFVTLILLFPLVSFHIQSFFSTSLYTYQLRFLKIILVLIFTTWNITTFTCYNFILPQFFNFFTQWEIHEKTTIFQLQLNAKIESYLTWINTLYNSFSCLFLVLVILIFLIIFFIQFNTIFFFLKYYRKLMSFLLTCILYIFSPPDLLFQVFLMLFSITFFELIFLFFCFKKVREVI